MRETERQVWPELRYVTKDDLRLLPLLPPLPTLRLQARVITPGSNSLLTHSPSIVSILPFSHPFPTLGFISFLFLILPIIPRLIYILNLRFPCLIIMHA